MKREVFLKYLEAVKKLYGLSDAEIFEKNRKRELVDARYLLWYLCYNRPMTISYIQKFMSEHGYTTAHAPIKNGVMAIQKRVEEDYDYQLAVERMRNII